MNLSNRPLSRAVLISLFTIALLAAGCSKKPVTKDTGNYTPPPSAVKPTASLTADRSSINPGDSVKLHILRRETPRGRTWDSDYKAGIVPNSGR